MLPQVYDLSMHAVNIHRGSKIHLDALIIDKFQKISCCHQELLFKSELEYTQLERKKICCLLSDGRIYCQSKVSITFELHLVGVWRRRKFQHQKG